MSFIDKGVLGVAVHVGQDEGDYVEASDVGGDLPIAVNVGAYGHSRSNEARLYLSRDLATQLRDSLGRVLSPSTNGTCDIQSCPQRGRYYDQHSLDSLSIRGPHGVDRRVTHAFSGERRSRG